MRKEFSSECLEDENQAHLANPFDQFDQVSPLRVPASENAPIFVGEHLTFKKASDASNNLKP